MTSRWIRIVSGLPLLEYGTHDPRNRWNGFWRREIRIERFFMSTDGPRHLRQASFVWQFSGAFERLLPCMIIFMLVRTGGSLTFKPNSPAPCNRSPPPA